MWKKIPVHTHHHAAEINSDPEGGVSVSSGGESETLVGWNEVLEYTDGVPATVLLHYHDLDCVSEHSRREIQGFPEVS